MNEGKSILWPIAYLIKDGLNACIGPYIPNLHNLVSAETDQMMSILIYGQVRNPMYYGHRGMKVRLR